MTDQLRVKIQKIYALIERGATEGEKQAARKALERIVKVHNLDMKDIDPNALKLYSFTYATILETWLFMQIWRIFLEKNNGQKISKDPSDRRLYINVTYEDYVLMDCAYEYFRRHMKGQYNKIVIPELKKKRKSKTRAKRRKELSELFFLKYGQRSNLFLPGDLVDVTITDQKEIQDREKMNGIEGGAFKKQVVTNNLLEY